MATNARIYWPIQAIGFAQLGANPVTTGLGGYGIYRPVKGGQSMGLSTTFNLEPLFQLGQISLYEYLENLPEVEVTVEKANDGTSLIEHLATPRAIVGTLAGRFNDNRCMGLMAFYNITQDAASGTPLSYVLLSGMYVNSVNWNIPVEGVSRETVTLSCRDKTWYYAPSGTVSGPWASGTVTNAASGRLPGAFTGSETTLAASGGAQRRQHVLMGSGYSVWPKELPGIDALNGFNLDAAGSGAYSAHIQNITVSTSLGRTDLFEQGRKGPYFRYANFPVEVTTSIDITASESGDAINCSETSSLTAQTIRILFNNGVSIDLGTSNKLKSVNQAGGDTGGGNATLSYQYSNFNDYTCKMFVTDPAGIS